MPNKFESINKAQFFDLSKKSKFDFDDVHSASCFSPPALENKFDSPLSDSEKKIVKALVGKNLDIVFKTYLPLIQELKKNDHLIDLDYLKTIQKNHKESDLAHQIIYRAWYFLSQGSIKQCVFQGQVPKKGLFSSRQDIANQWLSDVVSHLGLVFKTIMEKTENDRSAALYAVGGFVACFLITTYPEDFKPEMTFSEVFEKIKHL